MKNLKILGFLALFLGFLVLAPKVLAYGPNLTVTSNGSGSVILSINNASPNSSIQLSYMVPGSSLATTISNFGTTDGNGNYTTTVSSSSYGLAGSGQIYVTVGGQQSNMASVNGYSSGGYGSCGYYGCSSGSLAFSQNNVSVNVGQYVNVSVTAPYYGSNFYISSNSNSGIVSANINGSQITLYGLSYGSATLTVCAGGGINCGQLYVTVSNSANSNTNSFPLSQTNVSLSVGQTSNVTAYSTYNNLYISSNSNSGVVSASVSGNQINLYGLMGGTSTVTVCASGYSQCATIYVTVTSVLGANTNLWFSPGSASMYVGQSLAVSINSSVGYGTASSYSSTYNITSNSNSSVVSAGIVGTVLNLYARQNGTSNITVCNTSLGFCGTLTVTVGGGSGGTGTLSLSQTSVSLSVGQNTTVTASNNYGGSLYVSQNTNPSAASATAGSNSVYIAAQAAGSSTITVCSSYSGYCGTIYVTVTGSNLSFSPSNPTLVVGQTLTVSVYGNYSGYSLYSAGNTNSTVATITISGNTLTVYAVGSGSTTINICTNGASQCGSLYVSVSGYSYGGSVTLNPSSLNMAVGQSSLVTVLGPYNYSFYVSTNSNPGVASVSLSGNTLSVYAISYGATSINVCQSGYTQCATLSVNVGNGGMYGGGYGSGSLSLSQTNVSLSAGQTSYVTAANYSSGLYISSNSNPSAVAASVSGSQVTLYGAASGSSSITVCASGYSCGTIYVTVSGVITSPTGSGSVKGASLYNNGALVSENGTVYIVYKDTKTGFTSASVFRALGFSFSNVQEVGDSGLNDSGYTVSTANASHPWGSWIKNGKTIYFVHEDGLIPVPTLSVFANNGGQLSLIVPANHSDFSLLILSTMVVNDSRMN